MYSTVWFVHLFSVLKKHQGWTFLLFLFLWLLLLLLVFVAAAVAGGAGGGGGGVWNLRAPGEKNRGLDVGKLKTEWDLGQAKNCCQMTLKRVA